MVYTYLNYPDLVKTVLFYNLLRALSINGLDAHNLKCKFLVGENGVKWEEMGGILVKCMPRTPITAPGKSTAKK